MLGGPILPSGSRAVVKYVGQRSLHERVFLHHIAGREYQILTPDDERYVEDTADYERYEVVNGRDEYPAWVRGSVRAFEMPIANRDIAKSGVKSLGECVAEQRT